MNEWILQATAGKQPGRQSKAGKQIGNHQFAQTCRQEGGQAGKQASKQAGRHMCFCVCRFFRRNFARVRCEDGNIEFPAILGPKSPVFLGIPHEHNAVCTSGSSFPPKRGRCVPPLASFLSASNVFKGGPAAISAFLQTHILGAVRNFNGHRVVIFPIGPWDKRNDHFEQKRHCN